MSEAFKSRSVSQLGELSPQTGKHMAIISTGIGSKETAAIDIGVEGSVMSQTFIMPEGSTSLSFSYDFVSEEPLEYVGTEFNDSFAVRLRCGDEDISNKTYESINTST